MGGTTHHSQLTGICSSPRCLRQQFMVSIPSHHFFIFLQQPTESTGNTPTPIIKGRAWNPGVHVQDSATIKSFTLFSRSFPAQPHPEAPNNGSGDACVCILRLQVAPHERFTQANTTNIKTRSQGYLGQSDVLRAPFRPTLLNLLPTYAASLLCADENRNVSASSPDAVLSVSCFIFCAYPRRCRP